MQDWAVLPSGKNADSIKPHIDDGRKEGNGRRRGGGRCRETMVRDARPDPFQCQDAGIPDAGRTADTLFHAHDTEIDCPEREADAGGCTLHA